MSPDRSYIVGFSFLVLLAFFVLLWMVRNLMPSSEIASQRQPVSEPSAPSVDFSPVPGGSFQMPEVVASDPMKGPADARVTLMVFADFECLFCRAAHDVVMEVQRAHPNDVRVVWKDFPLPHHDDARALAFAARCAGEQGKFWEFVDRVFRGGGWGNRGGATAAAMSNRIAGEIGLTLSQFQQCVSENRYADRVGESINQGIRAELRGVPHLFVNRRSVAGLPTREELETLVADELKKEE